MARRRRSTKAEREFVSEAEEILERMRLDLADLGEQTGGDDEPDPEVVNRLFRSAHSLKGLGGLFGFEPVQDLAHHLEDVLDGLRLGRVSLGPSVMDVGDRAVAVFTALLEAVGDSEALERSAEPVARLVEEIEALREGSESEDDEIDALDVDVSLLRALTEYEEHRLRENLRRGRHILLVDATFEIISFEEGLSELTAAIREIGEVLSTLPAPGETSESQIRFSLLVACNQSASGVESHFDFPNTHVRDVAQGAVPAPAAPATAADAAAPPPREPRFPESADLESLKSISDTVRVDIRKLDELMNLVGELVIQRGTMGELVGRLHGSTTSARVANELTKVHRAIDRKLRELQSAVLDVRMVPLRQVFEKVSRVVRRLRSELEKDVRLELRGADTELDKLIVEELVDPMMHVIRNALDHAIESPHEREAAGKEPQGCIRIEAFQRGNHVVIAVSDDGRGIDAAALRARAEARGLVDPDESLSEREVLDLVFAPGISTRAEVTETSGRGVGMDVVRTNLTRLGGVVDVDSTPGRGTRISMTLPITLAIIQSLMVAVGRQLFAIPLNAVHETLLIDPDDIQRSEGREILNLRGEALILRRLDQELGIEADASDGKHFVVVAGMGDQRIGLVVDRVEGQQDTVIKPIQGPIRAVRGIAGATEIGGQNPVLVLDVSALLADAVGRREAA